MNNVKPVVKLVKTIIDLENEDKRKLLKQYCDQKSIAYICENNDKDSPITIFKPILANSKELELDYNFFESKTIHDYTKEYLSEKEEKMERSILERSMEIKNDNTIKIHMEFKEKVDLQPFNKLPLIEKIDEILESIKGNSV